MKIKLTRLIALILCIVIVSPLSGCQSQTATIPADAKNIKITAPDSLVMPSGNKIVTSSIPLPKGAISDVNNMVVFDSNDVELPMQTRVLSKWLDQSLKWVLVDFVAPYDAGNEFVLKYSKDIRRKESKTNLKYKQTDNGYTVDTGAVAFSLGSDSSSLLENIQINGNPLLDGGICAIVSTEGEQSGAMLPPEKVEIIDNGPVRIRFRLTGKHSNGFSYTARVDAFTGESAINVDYTFINTTDNLYYTDIIDISLKIPFSAGKNSIINGHTVEGTSYQSELTEYPLSYLQLDNKKYYIPEKNDPINGKLAGMFSVEGEKYGVTLLCTDFWQQYPKGIRASDSSLEYSLWPKESGQIIKFGEGSAKSHEFWIYPYTISNNKNEKNELTKLSNTADGDDTLVSKHSGTPEGFLSARHYGIVEPQAYIDSQALYNTFFSSGSANEALLEDLITAVNKYDETVTSASWNDLRYDGILKTGWYGMLDWGDWMLVKKDNEWGNLEYDTTLLMITAYTITGDLGVFDIVNRSARHYMDVDWLYKSVDGRYSMKEGSNHVHKKHHFSLDGKETFDFGHTWNVGLMEYYYITGDERALNNALSLAESHRNSFDKRTVSGQISSHKPRQFGWPIIAMMAAYRQTGDDSFLKTVKSAATEFMHQYSPLPNEEWSRFDLGIAITALADYHSLTKDAEVEKYLLEYAQNMLELHEQYKDIRFYPAIAYVWHLTQDNRYLLLCEEILGLGYWAGWGLSGSNGKALSMVGNHLMRIQNFLYQPK